MKTNQYQCAMCKGVFDEGWSDEEAMAETHQLFGKSFTPEECDVICDDCFNKIHPEKYPLETEQAVADQIRARNP
jgi:hypothetical protein